jgi:hypothetical protein
VYVGVRNTWPEATMRARIFFHAQAADHAPWANRIVAITRAIRLVRSGSGGKISGVPVVSAVHVF